jgi:hypothetical protein
VYEFSKHICALCVTRGTDVFRLGTKLGIDPMELLQMINGKRVTLWKSASRHGSSILGFSGKPQFSG